jgi:hypothetical protein
MLSLPDQFKVHQSGSVMGYDAAYLVHSLQAPKLDLAVSCRWKPLYAEAPAVFRLLEFLDEHCSAFLCANQHVQVLFPCPIVAAMCRFHAQVEPAP